MQLLLHKASLSSREIEEAAEWMVGTIMRCGGAPKAKVKRVGRKRGSLARETAT